MTKTFSDEIKSNFSKIYEVLVARDASLWTWFEFIAELADDSPNAGRLARKYSLPISIVSSSVAFTKARDERLGY